jgi:SH3 domain-containing YSC84-like protein 1
MHCLRSLTLSIPLAAAVAAGSALAAGQDNTTAQPAGDGEAMQAQTDARGTVQNAAAVAERMKSDAEIADLLQQAEGVFIVPDLLKGAFIVGAQGGDGVLISRQNGEWSHPAFYTLGSISVGAQGGGEQGAVAMILMSERAIQRFEESDTFSLSAEAGLTIVDYSASAEANLQDTDVVVWSDKQGAFVGASIRATDIGVDEEANHAYYDKQASPQAILSGQVQSQRTKVLQEALRQ